MTQFLKKPFIWNRIATLLAVSVTTLIASILSSQMVIAKLAGLGLKTSFSEIVSKRINLSRRLIFTSAGIVAILVMLNLMQRVFFGVPIIGGARESFGNILQALAGGIGGWVYAKLTTKKETNA